VGVGVTRIERKIVERRKWIGEDKKRLREALADGDFYLVEANAKSIRTAQSEIELLEDVKAGRRPR
jgi:hypothetical protein